MARKSAPLARPTAEAVLSDRFVTQGLRRLVVERHGGEGGLEREWAVFFELRNGTGHGGQTRYVDALALNLWPSKKHWRVAYELKASRADFLKELSKPEKRQWGTEISNEFYYVCAAGVAKEPEVPEGCGLLVADEALGKLRKVRPAQQREARDLTLTEVAAFARKTGERQGLLFQHAGRELTEADLDALLETRMDEFLRAKVATLVERDYKTKMSTVAHVLNRYARDLRDAGVLPPAWMEHELLGPASFWDAADWAKSLVVKPPGVEAVAESRQGLARALRELESAQRRVAEAAQAVNALQPGLPPAQPEPKTPLDEL